MMTYLTLIALFIPVSVKTYQYYIIQEANKRYFIEKSKAYNRKIEYDFSKLEIPEFEQLKELYVNGVKCEEIDKGYNAISVRRKFQCSDDHSDVRIFVYEDQSNLCEDFYSSNDESCYIKANKSLNTSLDDLSISDSLPETINKINLMKTDIIGRFDYLILTHSTVGKNFLIACFYQPQNEIYGDFPKDCQIYFNKRYQLRIIPADKRIFSFKEKQKFINLYEVIRDLKIDYE
ncbi:hypothetical protein [Leptospira ryugenii]|nr:hypothetical protein [Leptospira ryugenii]